MNSTLLLILDGCGLPRHMPDSAITPTTMPYLHTLLSRFGYASLDASGPVVGISPGQAGNSEVGHLTIGAGHTVPSTLEQILTRLQTCDHRTDPFWQEVRKHRTLHVIGLLSEAGIHGHIDSMQLAATLAAQCSIPHVYIHVLLDGVDSSPGTASALLQQLERHIQHLSNITIATVMGRRWATDRSGDINVTQQYIDSIFGKESCPHFSYAHLHDFCETHGSESTFPCHRMNGRYIRHNEAILLTNHRKDRTQQVAEMLQHTNPLFTFATVSEHIDEKHVYHPVRPLHRNVCSELSRNGLSFTRISESCKFPHVTYFFNGYQDGTDHAICVPSLPESEYTRHPEMQLCELTERIVGEIASPHGNGIIANIPNLDQIGHLGQMPLAQQTAHAVDAAVRRIHATCQQHRWNLILTADHGNADQMRTPDGASFSSHSTNPVPLLYIPNHPSRHLRICQKGSIAQIAPTLLNILHRPIPHWMMPSLLQQRCLKATTRRHI